MCNTSIGEEAKEVVETMTTTRKAELLPSTVLEEPTVVRETENGKPDVNSGKDTYFLLVALLRGPLLVLISWLLLISPFLKQGILFCYHNLSAQIIALLLSIVAGIYLSIKDISYYFKHDFIPQLIHNKIISNKSLKRYIMNHSQLVLDETLNQMFDIKYCYELFSSLTTNGQNSLLLIPIIILGGIINMIIFSVIVPMVYILPLNSYNRMELIQVFFGFSQCEAQTILLSPGGIQLLLPEAVINWLDDDHDTDKDIKNKNDSITTPKYSFSSINTENDKDISTDTHTKKDGNSNKNSNNLLENSQQSANATTTTTGKDSTPHRTNKSSRSALSKTTTTTKKVLYPQQQQQNSKTKQQSKSFMSPSFTTGVPFTTEVLKSSSATTTNKDISKVLKSIMYQLFTRMMIRNNSNLSISNNNRSMTSKITSSTISNKNNKLLLFIQQLFMNNDNHPTNDKHIKVISLLSTLSLFIQLKYSTKETKQFIITILEGSFMLSIGTISFGSIAYVFIKQFWVKLQQQLLQEAEELQQQQLSFLSDYQKQKNVLDDRQQSTTTTTPPATNNGEKIQAAGAAGAAAPAEEDSKMDSDRNSVTHNLSPNSSSCITTSSIHDDTTTTNNIKTSAKLSSFCHTLIDRLKMLSSSQDKEVQDNSEKKQKKWKTYFILTISIIVFEHYMRQQRKQQKRTSASSSSRRRRKF